MRCFVAVDVPDSVKPGIIELQEKLPGKGVKAVEKENLHYTLKFLGEIGAVAETEACAKLEEIAGKFRPFTMSIKGMGAFPSLGYIRVVWLGEEGLYELQKAVEDRLGETFGREKNITPHLTLARVNLENKEIASVIRENQGIEIGSFEVTGFKLKKSTLTRNGPVYEDVRTFRLG